MPNAPHIIRLHAAWKRTEVSRHGSLSNGKTISLPDTSPLQADTKELIYVRKFNSPSGLSSACRVELECELLTIAMSIALNGSTIASPLKFSIVDILAMIQPHNELVIHIAASKLDLARTATARLIIVEL